MVKKSMGENLDTWIKQTFEKYNNALNVFEENWTDNRLIGRNREVKYIIEYIAKVINGEPTHLLLVGGKGCGKTYVLRNIMSKFLQIPNKSYEINYIDTSIHSPKEAEREILRLMGLKSTRYNSPIVERPRTKHFFIIDHVSDTFRTEEYVKKVIMPFIDLNLGSLIIALRDETEQKKLEQQLSVSMKKCDVLSFMPYTNNHYFSMMIHRVNSSSIKIESWVLQRIIDVAFDMGHTDCAKFFGALRVAAELKLQETPNNEIIEKCKETLSDLTFLADHIDLSNIHNVNLLETLSSAINPLPRSVIYNAYRSKTPNPYSNVWMHKKLHLLKDLNVIEFVEYRSKNTVTKYVRLKHDPIYLKQVLKETKR